MDEYGRQPRMVELFNDISMDVNMCGQVINTQKGKQLRRGSLEGPTTTEHAAAHYKMGSQMMHS